MQLSQMPLDLVAGSRRAFPASSYLVLVVRFPELELVREAAQDLVCCFAAAVVPGVPGCFPL